MPVAARYADRAAAAAAAYLVGTSAATAQSGSSSTSASKQWSNAEATGKAAAAGRGGGGGAMEGELAFRGKASSGSQSARDGAKALWYDMIRVPPALADTMFYL